MTRATAGCLLLLAALTLFNLSRGQTAAEDEVLDFSGAGEDTVEDVFADVGLSEELAVESEGSGSDLASRPKEPKRTEDPQREQDLGPQARPGSTSGLIANLFSTFAQPTDSGACPGRCYHALAALMCETVLEDRPCPKPSMRCCVVKRAGEGTLKVATEAPVLRQEPTTVVTRRTIPSITTTTRAATTTTTTEQQQQQQQQPASSKADTQADLEQLPEPQALASQKSTKTCPGVCVARRIADYCEAALDIADVCSTDQRCCVSKDLYDGVSDPPKQFVILGKKPKPKPDKQPDKTDSGSSSSSDEVKVPEQKKCAGQCVTGLFSYLCDRVDTSVRCNNGGRCCLSRSARPEKRPSASSSGGGGSGLKCPGVCLPTLMKSFCKSPSQLLSDSRDCPNGQVCCDNSKQSTGNKNEPQNTRPASPAGGGGGAAGLPIGALLNQALGAAAGGGGGGGGLLGSLAPLAASFLGGGSGGGGAGNIVQAMLPALLGTGATRPRPPPPPPPVVPERVDVNRRPPLRQPPPPPGYPLQPPPPADPRPFCPDTCIGPFLSFTCFGGAEMTDLFRCGTKKEQCCAKKSNIRRHLNEQYYNNNNNANVEYPEYTGYSGEEEYHSYTPEAEYSPDYRPGPPPPPPAGDQYERPPPEFSYTGQPALPSRIDTGGGHIQIFQNPAASVEQPPPPPPRRQNKYVCGVKGTERRARVVGGADAVPGEWCWHVALINSLNQYLCGGALIGTQWVLTAAHCVTNIVRSGDAIYVRVGDHDLTSKYGSPGAQTLRVSTTYIHHNHNSQTLDNDIALLKLHGQVELKEGVCLVCLPARGMEQQAGNRCTVSGYGYMGETGPIPLHVRAAELPIVSDNECVRKINAVTEKIFILPASSFCAGGEEGNDACQGDGGGPLVCNVDGYYELSGIVSWGFGCGRQDVPGVYVKVSSFIGWINQIISVNNL